MEWESETSLALREGADEIRSHLVMLRGGAPFLSSADALLLVQWLDDGIGVPSVLCALERASEARRRSRSRIPLRLGHAKRHLGKVARPAWHRPTQPSADARPLAALLEQVRVAAARDRTGAPLQALAERLAALDCADPDAWVREALASIRLFFEDAWAALDRAERETLSRAAEDELGDLVDLVDAGTAASITEETARDLFRQRYPWLSAGTVHALVEGVG
ncbi:MAG: hypothetical protein ACI9K2_001968 [Myxococcota bacterium]|jgi:hypothetical protein